MLNNLGNGIWILVNDLNELDRKSLDLWSILHDSSSFGNGSVIDNLPIPNIQEVYFQSTIDLRKSNIVHSHDFTVIAKSNCTIAFLKHIFHLTYYFFT